MIGIVQNRFVDKIAAVKAFLGVRVKSDSYGGAAEKRQYAADS